MESIVLCIILILTIIGLGWDEYSYGEWPHKDMTVSGQIYRMTHRWPIIVAPLAVAITLWTIWGWDLEALIGTLYLAHFTWKA